MKKRRSFRNIISEREAELPEAEMGKLLKILVERKDIISLGPGEPDFTPPKHVIAATKAALQKGETHYSPIEGRKELHEAIIKKLKKENRITATRENLIVTNGSTEGIMLSLMATVDPGEHVLVPDPGFICYIPMVEILNGYPISIPLQAEEGFQIYPERIRGLIKEPKKLRAMIINSPSNPTGTVYSKRILEGIADVAVDNDILVITDEAYEKFVYGGSRHYSIASLNGMEDYVLSLFSFSKTHGMAGFRIGYAVGPEKIIQAMRKLHIYTTLTASTANQLAAAAALGGSQAHIAKHVREYNRRRKYMCKRLSEMDGFYLVEPKGAFYAFPKINFKMSSAEFSRFLINRAKVATVPGDEFGRFGKGFIRLSYATELKLIEQAMHRIEKAVRKLK